MRAFVAVFPPPEVRAEAVAAATAATQCPDGQPTERVRWSRPENVHLTLKFLGEVRAEALEALCDAVQKLCERHTPFEVGLAGLGAFPSARRARILWAGVGVGARELRFLAADVETALAPLGFEREDRAYTPHLTVGRVRGRPASFELPPVALDPVFRVESVDLVESTLTQSGSVYEIVEAFALRS